MNITDFLRYLKEASVSGISLAAYIVTLIAYTFLVITKNSKLNTLLKNIEKIPAEDRAYLVERELNVHVKSGISPTQYVESKKMSYVFWIVIAIVFCFLIIVLQVLTIQGNDEQKQKPVNIDDHSTTIINNNIDNVFNNYIFNTTKNYISDPVSQKYFKKYLQDQKVTDFCDNGDFESGFDSTKWEYKRGHIGGGVITMMDTSFKSNFFRNARVSNIKDRNTNEIIPGRNLKNKYALKLGDEMTGTIVDALSKKILVTENTKKLSFLYYPVLENPQHDAGENPVFSVKVFDNDSGLELPNVCDLGNNKNTVDGGKDVGFLKVTPVYNNAFYRSWTCGKINLENYVGKIVSIYFTIIDCSLGGHFGYVYLDNFCTCN